MELLFHSPLVNDWDIFAFTFDLKWSIEILTYTPRVEIGVLSNTKYLWHIFSEILLFREHRRDAIRAFVRKTESNKEG